MRKNCVDRIEDLAAFVAVVEQGSLTSAARHLGRSLQSVSRSLAALEGGLGVELVRRTTRRSAPTDAGIAFHGRVKPALADIEEATVEVVNGLSEPSGTLRISAPTAFGPLHVVPAVAAFLDLYPRVEVDLELSDRFVDLIEGGFDLAVRIGDMPDSSLRAKHLAESRRVVFAAPSYLHRHGRPKRPEDLAQHQCIVRTAARDGNAWPFTVERKVKTIKVVGRFRTNGAAATNEAAVCGLGIANAPLWQVRSLADRGLVELVLARFESPSIPVHAVWAATRVPPAKTRLFVELLAKRLTTVPQDSGPG